MVSEYEVDDRWVVLAESAGFRVEHQYELARLINKVTGAIVLLGEHYGDPRCAVIGANEQWFAVGGDRVTIYDPTNGCREFLRSTPPVPVPVSAMREEEGGVLRVMIDPWADNPGTWEIVVGTGVLRKVSDGPDLRDQPWREDVPY